MKQVHPTQNSPYASPWSKTERIKMLLWEGCWSLLCSWTPKPMNPWRLFILRLFGARIKGIPFVHQRARINSLEPTLHNRACLGDRANAYSLGSVNINEGATIAQEAYLCTGTHDFTILQRPLRLVQSTLAKELLSELGQWYFQTFQLRTMQWLVLNLLSHRTFQRSQ